MNLIHSIVHFFYSFFFLNWLYFLNSDTYNLTSPLVKIVVGANEWFTGGVLHDVSDIIVHENYIYADDINDIAVIRVEPPIEFTEKVQPIKYTAKAVPPGSILQTTGWGYLEVLSLSSTKKFRFTLINWSICPTVNQTQ